METSVNKRGGNEGKRCSSPCALQGEEKRCSSPCTLHQTPTHVHHVFPLHFAPHVTRSKSKFKIKTLEGGFGNLIVNGKSYTDGYKPNTILH
jgi:hypothetical protein